MLLKLLFDFSITTHEIHCHTMKRPAETIYMLEGTQDGFHSQCSDPFREFMIILLYHDLSLINAKHIHH